MKRKSGCGSWVLAIALIAGVVFGIEWLADRIDRQRFPWGYASSGRPTLVGTWVGPVTTGSGQRIGMLVDIQLAPLDRGRRRKPIIRTRRNRWLEGRVLMCPPSGGMQKFTMSGAPDDTRAASRFHLSLSPADSVAPADGLAPSHMQGRWSGGDAVDLSISFYLRRGKSAITSSDDPDTGRDTQVTLKRGTDADLNALCRR